MSYGADFANADPVGAPLDPVILIGAEPSFWAAMLLGLIAALLAGYVFGTRSNARRADAAQAIWKAVHEASRSAMGADDNALKGRAETLLNVLDARLGKTLSLVGGLSETVDKLRQGVRGRRPRDSHSADVRDPDHGRHQGDDQGHGDGHGGSPDAAGPQTEAPVSHAAPAVTIVNVNAGTAGRHSPGGHSPAGGRDLTQREQTDLLRLAVAAFNQHWREESLRVGELRAAHAELSNPGPSHPPTGRISGTDAKH